MSIAAERIEEADEEFAALIGKDRLRDLAQLRGQPIPPGYLGDDVGAKLSRIVEGAEILMQTAIALSAYQNELTPEEQQDVHDIEALVARAFEIAQS